MNALILSMQFFLYDCGKDGAVTGTHEAARHSISMPKRLCPKVSSIFVYIWIVHVQNGN